MNENLWMNGEKNHHKAAETSSIYKLWSYRLGVKIGGDARATRTQLPVPKTNLVQPGDTVVPPNHDRDDWNFKTFCLLKFFLFAIKTSVLIAKSIKPLVQSNKTFDARFTKRQSWDYRTVFFYIIESKLKTHCTLSFISPSSILPNRFAVAGVWEIWGRQLRVCASLWWCWDFNRRETEKGKNIKKKKKME